jgi:hypothetical protein
MAEKNRWHLFLGTILKELLTPVGVTVLTEVPVRSEPAKADILLLRKDKPDWTLEQKAVLPDGIRDCRAEQVLIEFKYTENFSEEALFQTIEYQRNYLEFNQLKPTQLQCFLVVAQHPLDKNLQEFGYHILDKKGVYFSKTDRLARRIPLISLNKLSHEPHNAWIRCFASRKKERDQALIQARKLLNTRGLRNWSQALYLAIGYLYVKFFGRSFMDVSNASYTPEEMQVMNEKWGPGYLQFFSLDELLAKFDMEEVLEHLDSEIVLNHLDSETVLNHFDPEERLKGLQPEERLKGLQPEERLKGLQPEERLQGLTPEQIEAYMKKIKR